MRGLDFWLRTAPKDFAFLGADLHAHLIPGIDDGPATLSEALDLAASLHAWGFRRLSATTHSSERYPHDATAIRVAGAAFQRELAERFPDLPCQIAAEYRLDARMEGMLRRGDPLLCIDERSRTVLVELPFVGAPLQLEFCLFTLCARGYRPLLAHPERYLYMAGDTTAYARLRDLGCLFQINLPSLSGYYGRPVQENARFLMRKGWVDALATDAHHSRHLDALRALSADASLMRRLARLPLLNADFL